MSWSFFHHGNDKAALKDACRKSFERSSNYYDPTKTKVLFDPVIAVVEAAIDAAIKPKDAYCLKVESNGSAGDNQCYFGVTVTPVYLPHLVDKPLVE